MDFFRKFMLGRYGGDQLSLALLICSVLMTFGGELADIQLLVFAGYIPLGVCIYRMLSRNISARRMENYKFAMLMSPAYSKLKKFKSRAADLKTHKYFKCPNCKVNLRVPKGKGNIIITCPKCKTELRKRT